MGFIRGGLLVIVSVFLFVLLFIGIILFTLTLSLKYENVQEQLAPTIYNFADKEVGESLNELVERVYYKEYDCNFWSCLEGESIPLFLVSEKARDYWKSKFFLNLTIVLILFSLIFLLVKNKYNSFVIAGILLVLSSLILLRMNFTLSLFSNTFVVEFLKIFFSKAKTVFWMSFILGASLLVLGILFKLFSIGFKISEFFHRREAEKAFEKQEKRQEKIEDKKSKKQSKKEFFKLPKKQFSKPSKKESFKSEKKELFKLKKK